MSEKERHIPRARLQCTVCDRRRRDGFQIKKCYGCRLVYYCSLQCERKHWPQHRARCVKVAGQAISGMVNVLMSDWYMFHKLKLVLVEECCFSAGALVRNVHAFARSTLVVILSMTFEPAKFTDAISSWALGEKWKYKGVEGMVQINGVTSRGRIPDDWPDDYAKRTMEDSWTVVRRDADRKGHHADAVVLAIFRDTPCNGLDNTFPIIISSHELKNILDRARNMSPTKLNASIDKHLLDLNNYIRNDAKNRLPLTMPLRKMDKNFIMNALVHHATGFDVELLYAEDYKLLHTKIFSSNWLPDIEQSEENLAIIKRQTADGSLSLRDRMAIIFRLPRKGAQP